VGVMEIIDFPRWYRELFKKYTAVRDMTETHDCERRPLMKMLQKWMDGLKTSTDVTEFEHVSVAINEIHDLVTGEINKVYLRAARAQLK
jgi:hypothetical protein